MADINILIKAKDLASKSIHGVKKELGGLDKGVNRLGRGTRAALGNVEKGVAIGAGAAAAGIAYAVKSAIDFEDAFAGVKKTVDEVDLKKAGLSFEDLSNDIRQMARTMPLGVEQIAAIAEQAGALGVAAPDIAEFTRVSALLGVTTNVSAEDAATALGQLQNVLGLTSKDYARFGATLVDLGNKGASTEADILEIARRAGGATHTFGIAADATLGWASAFANLGMQPELAGTSLQTFITKSATAVSKGKDDLKELADVAGMSSAKFKKLFQTDASGALQAFIKGLTKLKPDQRLRAVQDIFGKTSGLTRSLLGLAESYDRNLVPSLDNADKAWKDNTALTAEADKRFETTASQLQVLKNNVKDAAITIGSALLPELGELSKEGVSWIQKHQPEIKAFAKDLGNGFRDAVKWIRSLDWDAITETLKMGAGVAKGIVSAFTGAPPWVQAFLTTGFVANKFTGGMLGDVVGDVAKGLIKGVLGIQAGVVNVNAGVVNGAGGAGVAGAAAGAGKGGLLGKLGAFGGLAKLVGGAAGLALLTGSSGTSTEGILGNIGGGALTGAAVAGPLGAVAGAGIGAVKATAENQSAMNSQIAQGVSQNATVFLAQNPTTSELQRSLDAVNSGISQIESNPLNVLVQGSALDELRATKAKIEEQLAAQKKAESYAYETASHGQAMVNRQKELQQQFNRSERADDHRSEGQKKALTKKMEDVGQETETGASKVATATHLAESAARVAGLNTSSAVFSIGSQIVTAIWAARPVISSTTVINNHNTQSYYGETSSSRNKDKIT